MRLIRVSWDRDLGTFMVETGKQVRYKLSKEEEIDLENLRNQLEPYGDFLNVGDLDPEERDIVFEAKARRAELETKASKEEIIWIPKPKDEVSSVVLVICPDRTPIYVENMPISWIDKLFTSQIIIQEPQWILGTRDSHIPLAEEDSFLDEVKKCLSLIEGQPKFKGAKTYLDCVNVTDSEEYVIVMPKKYLEDDWSPINKGLNEEFGEDAVQWTTAKKESHWKVYRD